MKEGGWRAFREASKQQAISETATAELERPAVAHRAFAPPPDAPVPQPHETKPRPDAGSESADDAEAEDEEASDEDAEGASGEAEDSDEDAEEDAGPSAARTGVRKLIADARALLGQEATEAEKRLDLGPRFTLAHWSVLAIVPVAAAASLLAVRAGLNPYALCLQWWDVLFGTVFLTACVMFLGLAIWKRPRGAWHPGAPALIVAVAVLPFWAGTNAAFGSGCEEIPLTPTLVPPLPPPIEVPTLWAVPMPVPRPMELGAPSQPLPLPLPSQGEVQIHPPPL